MVTRKRTTDDQHAFDWQPPMAVYVTPGRGPNRFRFLQLGVWDNGYAEGTFSGLIDSMQPGDGIAAKSDASIHRTVQTCPLSDQGH